MILQRLRTTRRGSDAGGKITEKVKKPITPSQVNRIKSARCSGRHYLTIHIPQRNKQKTFKSDREETGNVTGQRGTTIGLYRSCGGQRRMKGTKDFECPGRVIPPDCR